jgi:ABC-type transport system involved in cytochrome c biogenesis ATPase subunit
MKIKIIGLFGRVDYDLDLSRKINLLIGENGDGKTTILKIINSIFSYDFVKLATVKFDEIIITNNHRSITIKRDDLFALNDYYFPQISYIYDETYLKKAIESHSNKIFGSISNSFNRDDYKQKNVSDNKYLEFRRFSFFSGIVKDIISDYGRSGLNDYITTLLNGIALNNTENLTDQLSHKSSVFAFVKKKFKNNKKLFSISDFNNFLLENNSFIQLPMEGINTKLIARSKFFLTENYLNAIFFLYLINNSNYNDAYKNNNLPYVMFNNPSKVTHLNMVETFNLNWNVNREEPSTYLNRKRSFSREDWKAYGDSMKYNYRLIGSSNKEKYLELLLDQKLEPYVDIGTLYDSDTLNYFFSKVSSLVSKIDKDNNSFNTSDFLGKLRKINYYLDQSIIDSMIRLFKPFTMRSDNANDSVDSDIKIPNDKGYFDSSDYKKFKKASFEKKYKSDKTDYFYSIRSFARYLSEILIIDTENEKYELTRSDKSFYQVFDAFYDLLVDLWAKRLDSIKNFEDILNGYLVGKKVTIEPSKKLLIKDLKGNIIPVEYLSSGEKKIISFFKTIIFGSNDGYFLIDEPELSLSILWQTKLLSDLNAIIGDRIIIIATQSNHIVTDEFGKYIVPLINVR